MIITCDKAIEIDSHYTESFVYKAVAFENLGKKEESIACYDKALEINPTNAYASV
jgi:Tfp pilus assembly protein PilF